MSIPNSLNSFNSFTPQNSFNPSNSLQLKKSKNQFFIPDPLEQLESSSPLYRYRANIQLFDRLMAITAISLGWGFLIGTYTGAKAAGLQYLAENAHKPPKTKGEWYFYHKHKNVRMILGGFQSGFRLSRKTGLVCLSFGVIEGGLDELRKENDFFNSCAAGLASALIISGFYRLPRQSTKYACIIGLGFGLLSGGLQDYLKYIQGQKIWYLDLLKKK
ncbi:hypothetical protein Glove_150g53 [Diversispora epigaea]|uniref:Mitochondrial import inner membrane translocase subunit TIM22 n=1 Tax=Diversispora epigaea TaxID=1348612 RepID=A0A397ITD2_9GLOM|nr:hypothetical protein Glove_150g53 [Diversispora epigaea]